MPANYFVHLNLAALVAGLLEDRLGMCPPLALLAERKDAGQEIKGRRRRLIYSQQHLFIRYFGDLTPFLQGNVAMFLFWVGVALIFERTQGGD
jgi:hypothetical protein